MFNYNSQYFIDGQICEYLYYDPETKIYHFVNTDLSYPDRVLVSSNYVDCVKEIED